MAEEGQTGAVARNLPKSQPSLCQSSPPASLPRRAAFSAARFSPRLRGQPASRTGPRTAAQGPGPAAEAVLSAVHLSGAAKPLCPARGEQLSGGAGGAALGAATRSLFCCQADFIQKLPSWWETAVPQVDLFKEHSVLRQPFNRKTLRTRFMN